jgi:hypothetical protein
MAHKGNVGLGALAVALGLSTAVANAPAGWAQPSESDQGGTPSQSAADKSAPDNVRTKPLAGGEGVVATGHVTDADVAAVAKRRDSSQPARRRKNSTGTQKDVASGPGDHTAGTSAPTDAPAARDVASPAVDEVATPPASSPAEPATAEVSTATTTPSEPRNMLPDTPTVAARSVGWWVSTVLGQLLGSGSPGSPGPSPLQWTVLAWARRELEQSLSQAMPATPAAVATKTSPVTPVSPAPSAHSSVAVTSTVGSFPVTLVNNTGGVYNSNQIYVTLIGQVTPGTWSWIDSTGVAHKLDHTAANAPGHLVKNGVNYANMSFTLAQAQNLTIPPTLQAARMYISEGQPLYIRISPDNSGWAGPDSMNPSDPNYNTTFDWYEMTYSNGRTAFGGNTTQVDQFGLPIKVTLTQTASGYSQTRGITLTRAQVFARYVQSVPAAFQALVVKDAAGKPLRIVSPRTSTPGALATWMDQPVNNFWTTYTNKTFTYNGPGYTVAGHVNASGLFAYTVTSAGVSTAYTMRKPTTAEVFANSGPFVGSGLQGAFLAQLAAAFNRGVASTPTQWNNVAAYYPAGTHWNAYAKFFHDIGVGNRAYGFPYDDVNGQSSVQILGNAQPPTRLTISIG